MQVLEVEPQVKGEGASILFGDREGELGEPPGRKVGIAVAKQVLADSRSAVFRKGANLRDVATSVRTREQSNTPMRVWLGR
jgi:hypothetical protein